MTNKPPMTDFEKQRLMDLDQKARDLAVEHDNIHVVHLCEFKDDPFRYTKELLTALCQVTGRTIPSDEEIRGIVEQAMNDIDKEL